MAHKPITDDEVATFRKTLRGSGVKKLVAHDSYLINLASPNEQLYRTSIESFVVEMQRAELLGIQWLVTHPGASMDCTVEQGLDRVAAALDEVHARCQRFKVRILLETTAGQGTCLGHRFEHFAAILARVKEPQRLGICLDTCHVFAAGYALAPLPEYQRTMQEFDKLIGVKRIEVLHLNDSLKPLGSRVDRHAHVGQGALGLEPFRHVVNDRQLRSRPMILETPKGESDGVNWDTMNLQTLRGLVATAAK